MYEPGGGGAVVVIFGEVVRGAVVVIFGEVVRGAVVAVGVVADPHQPSLQADHV